MDKNSEDAGSTFFDADNDGDLDLYVCSGGNQFPPTSDALLDRLYLNDGRGNFTRSEHALPFTKFESTSTVAPADYDGDGDNDLFVGSRLEPLRYGYPVNGYIFNNDGTGKFRDVTSEVAPGLVGVGMITDAVWADIDGDGDQDLMISGEYMPLTVFVNTGKGFENATVDA